MVHHPRPRAGRPVQTPLVPRPDALPIECPTRTSAHALARQPTGSIKKGRDESRPCDNQKGRRCYRDFTTDLFIIAAAPCPALPTHDIRFVASATTGCDRRRRRQLQHGSDLQLRRVGADLLLVEL